MCFSYLWVSVKGLGSVFALKVWYPLRGRLSQFRWPHLKTVGRERTSTNLPFVSSTHSHTYQLCISWESTRMWHDVHVFGDVCS